ncbi:hypothetical protein Scep_012780 [Stephania cephalantha]|uniref:Uncharacterized protein n=1 Tax=Stephania cephalantha TaxID=152367 RepID=A0AAP0P6S9_9MAGN
MARSVVPKFCQVKKTKPTPRFVTPKATEVGLVTAVENLSLPISLRVIRAAVTERVAKMAEQFVPKMARKDLVPITDD